MALLEGKSLSNVDAAWLRMESATNLMLISGVMSFYEKLDYSELKELIEDRLLPFFPALGRGGWTTRTSTSSSTCKRRRCPIPGIRRSFRRWSARS